MERAIDARDWAGVARVLEEEGNVALVGQEELVIACLANDAPLATLDLLVRNGADCNEENSKGDSPLMLAVFYKKPLEYIQLLIEEGGARVNAQNEIGNTALILAAVVDACPQVAQYLVNKGAAVDIANKYDNTPLLVCAVENSSGALAQVLLTEEEAARRDQNGNTALILACERDGNDALVRALLGKSQVNAQNAHGNHALGLACWKGCRASLARILLEEGGADVLLRNHDSRSPLQLAKDGRSASQELLDVLERAQAERIHALTEQRFSGLGVSSTAAPPADASPPVDSSTSSIE